MPSTRPVFPKSPLPIRTARLLLRRFSPSDVKAFHALRTEPAIYRNFQSRSPDATERDTEAWMSRFMFMPPGSGDTHGFAVEEQGNDGVVIGFMGVHQYPLMGYVFQRESWGKGYATEALRGWLDAYWQLDERQRQQSGQEGDGGEEEDYVEARTLVDNVASQKVLGKAGFVRTGRCVDDVGRELIVFRMTRSEGLSVTPDLVYGPPICVDPGSVDRAVARGGRDVEVSTLQAREAPLSHVFLAGEAAGARGARCEVRGARGWQRPGRTEIEEWKASKQKA
ncbi:MAG: hypothetical protein M1819_002883 [Sarea resinae]|nr:MAG: hypothetical protein M1819_002883 [Sarea resinae]